MYRHAVACDFKKQAQVHDFINVTSGNLCFNFDREKQEFLWRVSNRWDSVAIEHTVWRVSNRWEYRTYCVKLKNLATCRTRLY